MIRSLKSRAIFLVVPAFCLASLLAGSPSRGAGPAVSIQKVDESTVIGTLSGLQNGQIILSSPDAKIPLEDLVVLENKGAAGSAARPAPAVANAPRKLTATWTA